MKQRIMEFHRHHGQRIHMQTKLGKPARSKAKSTAAKSSSQLIAEQTAAFLKAGGQITKIRSGTRDQEANAGNEQTK